MPCRMLALTLLTHVMVALGISAYYRRNLPRTDEQWNSNRDLETRVNLTADLNEMLTRRVKRCEDELRKIKEGSTS